MYSRLYSGITHRIEIDATNYRKYREECVIYRKMSRHNAAKAGKRRKPIQERRDCKLALSEFVRRLDDRIRFKSLVEQSDNTLSARMRTVLPVSLREPFHFVREFSGDRISDCGIVELVIERIE